MDSSSSELCFRKFLEGGEPPVMNGEGLSVERDPSEYALMLKKKLDIYCAAVAKSRAYQESSLVESGATTASRLVSQASFNANETMNNNSSRTNSCSSKDFSEGDPAAEDETLENTGHVNEKKTRRMLSNRESARRSRKRKQAHLINLESQVSQLRAENVSLIERLSEMTQNYNDASIGNQVLKAHVETLKSKVKMAEETLRTIDMCGTSSLTMSLSDASVPQKDEQYRNTTPHFSGEHNSNIRNENHGIEILVSEMMKGNGSVRRVASLELLRTTTCIDQWDVDAWHNDQAPAGSD